MIKVSNLYSHGSLKDSSSTIGSVWIRISLIGKLTTTVLHLNWYLMRVKDRIKEKEKEKDYQLGTREATRRRYKLIIIARVTS
jgi:hypothetical protein